MANHLYSHQKPLSSIYSTATAARSTIDTSPTYYPDNDHDLEHEYPRYSSLSFDYPSFSRFRSLDSTASRTFLPTSTSSSLWPSFDVSSSSFAKRPSQAIYNQSVLHAHMIGQNEAWLTSDSLAKRPKLESASNLPYYPQRPGEKDCTHYMLTRTCKFGDTCKFDHPIWVPAGGIPDWKEPPSIPYESHPQRPGEPDCPYFLKTQKCKFGLKCKFNHPKDKMDPSSIVDTADLPERPSEPLCSFYMKTGICKFRASCKFHHPKDIQVPSDGQEAVDGAQSHSLDHIGVSSDKDAVKMLSSIPAHSFNSKGLPMRPGEVDCPFYMKTGSCKYGVNCRYNHPDWNVINPAASVVGHTAIPALANNVGLVNPAASIFHSLQPGLAQTTFGQVPVLYPQRPGQMECDYYMKSGECKFGERCKFHHPIDRSAPTRNQSLEQNVKFTLAGLPRREGVQHCPFYMKTGTCSYGVNCKFDHPPPGEVMASVGKETPTKAEEGKENEEEVKENEENSENATAEK